MMLPAPRVLAIDDDAKHLDSLIAGLNAMGAACRRVHFTGNPSEVKECRHVRVVFADLHLQATAAGSGEAQHFSAIGGLLQLSIKPIGPYLIVLWTRFPEQALALAKFLEDRMKDAPRPIAVVPISKESHLDLDGNVKNVEALLAAIEEAVASQPQVAALFDWEEAVHGAAAATVSSLVDMIAAKHPVANRPAELGRLLAHLAEAAVGASHVEENRFRAVNEALLPILADRLTMLRSLGDASAAWATAFLKADVALPLTEDEASQLNRLVHIDEAQADGTPQPGTVLALAKDFVADYCKRRVGLGEADLARAEYCKKHAELGADAKWVLVQTQAACDYAQPQCGPTPFCLGLEVPAFKEARGMPKALWQSIPFERDGKARVLLVNARFPVQVEAAEIAKMARLYRIREAVLFTLIHHIQTYGLRPGILQFRPKP